MHGFSELKPVLRIDFESKSIYYRNQLAGYSKAIRKAIMK